MRYKSLNERIGRNLLKSDIKNLRSLLINVVILGAKVDKHPYNKNMASQYMKYLVRLDAYLDALQDAKEVAEQIRDYSYLSGINYD